MEKEMATHSSILAWKAPWTEEPGGLQSTGSQKVGHDRATSFSLSSDFRNSKEAENLMLCTQGATGVGRGSADLLVETWGSEGLASFPLGSHGEFWGYVEMGSMEGPGEAESQQSLHFRTHLMEGKRTH